MYLSKNNLVKTIFLISFIFMVIVSNVNSQSAVIEWRLFASYPPTTLPLLSSYAEMVKEATDGKLEINVFFPGEHPYDVSEVLTALRDGRCQIAEIEGAYYAGTEPVLAITGTPMVMGSAESMYAMHEALLDAGVLQEVYDRYNAMNLAFATWYGTSISSSKSLINDENSLSGQKIRVPTKQHADVVSWIGGSPVTISWAEVYTSLQRGVIDGGMGALSAQRASKWTEVAPYVTRLAEAIGMDSILVNKDAFNSLPEDVQEGLIEASLRYQEVERERRSREDAIITVQAMHEDGIVVRALPDRLSRIIREKAPAYTKEWAEDAGKGSVDAYNVIKEVLGWK